MRPLRAHCHRGLGTLYAQIGQRERAHAELAETAMKMYQSMDMTFRLPKVRRPWPRYTYDDPGGGSSGHMLIVRNLWPLLRAGAPPDPYGNACDPCALTQGAPGRASAHGCCRIWLGALHLSALRVGLRYAASPSHRDTLHGLTQAMQWRRMGPPPAAHHAGSPHRPAAAHGVCRGAGQTLDALGDHCRVLRDRLALRRSPPLHAPFDQDRAAWAERGLDRWPPDIRTRAPRYGRRPRGRCPRCCRGRHRQAPPPPPPCRSGLTHTEGSGSPCRGSTHDATEP